MKIILRLSGFFFLLLALLSGCSPAARRDSAVQLPIPLAGSLQNPAWSADGNSIVFTRFRNGYNKGPADLVLYDIQSKQIRILVADGSDNINLPGSAWNAVTNQIVFSSSRAPHDEIFIINADDETGNEIKITHRKHQAAYEPFFSPDGHWVVFESHPVDVEINGVITKVTIDGTQPYQTLTNLNADCRQPNWSPDGQFILYQAFNGTQWNIWIMDSDGNNQRQITHGEGDKTDASFSADGDWIVYSADGPTMKFANLFIIHIPDGETIQLTHFNGYDGAASWSPNAEKIVFESVSGTVNNSPGSTIWIIDAPQQK